MTTPGGITSYTYPANSDRLGSLAGLLQQTDSYDASGNLQADGEVAYTYDARGRMASAAVGGVTTYFGVNGLGQRIVKRGANVLGAFGYRYGSSGHMLLRQRIPRTTAAALSGQIEYMYDEAGHLIGEYDQTAGPLEETVYLGDTPVAVLQGTGASAAIYAVSADNIDAPHIIAANSGTPAGPGITRHSGRPRRTRTPPGSAASPTIRVFPGRSTTQSMALATTVPEITTPLSDDMSRATLSDWQAASTPINTSPATRSASKIQVERS